MQGLAPSQDAEGIRTAPPALTTCTADCCPLRLNLKASEVTLVSKTQVIMGLLTSFGSLTPSLQRNHSPVGLLREPTSRGNRVHDCFLGGQRAASKRWPSVGLGWGRMAGCCLDISLHPKAILIPGYSAGTLTRTQLTEEQVQTFCP